MLNILLCPGREYSLTKKDLNHQGRKVAKIKL